MLECEQSRGTTNSTKGSQNLFMLSYRHSYHAGNFADVLKHCVWVHSLEYITQKDKPVRVIDTHAGAGGYKLPLTFSEKPPEYKNGIAKLWQKNHLPQALSRYLECIVGFNKSDTLEFYPGSPALTQHLLRKQDTAYFYELHSSDFPQLKQMTRRNKNIHVRMEDGFSSLKALLPPPEKRALILVDPSYEIKTDYDKVVNNLCMAHARFPTGTYILWYPVVDRARINAMEKKFMASGIRNIQLFELGLEKDHPDYGMTSSGVIVINPAWTLWQSMEKCLPYLSKHLGVKGEGFYRQVELVTE